jgi:SAM-dependent methyltransferase
LGAAMEKPEQCADWRPWSQRESSTLSVRILRAAAWPVARRYWRECLLMPDVPPVVIEFKTFSGAILASPEIAAVAQRCGLGPEEATQLLATYANEAGIGLELVAPLLRPGMHVLEVGCGIGLLASFLRQSGVDITGLEPGASGFGFMPEIGSAILCRLPQHLGAPWLGIGAEQLDRATHGQFDLIYSTNVLEHIPDLAGAFRGMASVLAPGGIMVHLCPNYTVPYEPHFGIPLVPFFTRATAHLYRKATKRLPGVWEGLNFITASGVKRLAHTNRLSVSFDRGVLAAAMRRFDRDPLFRERQGGLAGKAQSAARALGLLGLLEKMPAELASPMIMRLQHSSTAAKPKPQDLHEGGR